MIDISFYKNKKVLVTGHTGFKGTWLCKILVNAGAIVTGYSLEPDANNTLFSMTNIAKNIHNIYGDIRDYDKLKCAFEDAQPEIVIHMAAQPIVRESYKNPRTTYETNVMGTVNVLECIRIFPCVKSFLNVTTDKVYKNNEWFWGYREDETLDGFDPYSNSKSCSELVTNCYKNSFLRDIGSAISTARAGNVIGGGDFSKDRIIPDCVRAAYENEKIYIRNPHSIRPYQHVLEPLVVYLMIAEKQYKDIMYAGSYNVGPDECDSIHTIDLVKLFCQYWGDGLEWEQTNNSLDLLHESKLLKLDCSKLKMTFGWKPRWNIDKCIEMTTRLYKVIALDGNVDKEMDKEIKEFLGD